MWNRRFLQRLHIIIHRHTCTSTRISHSYVGESTKGPVYLLSDVYWYSWEKIRISRSHQVCRVSHWTCILDGISNIFGIKTIYISVDNLCVKRCYGRYNVCLVFVYKIGRIVLVIVSNWTGLFPGSRVSFSVAKRKQNNSISRQVWVRVASWECTGELVCI